MISSHFWFGVVFIYLGLLLCCLECCYEPWFLRRSHWVWLAVMGTIIAGITTFSIMVPLARAPLDVLAHIRAGEYPPGTVMAGIEWVPEFTELRVALVNPTDMDYERVDLFLDPDESIAKIGQVSTVAGVSFIGDVTKEESDIGGVYALIPEIQVKDQGGRVINIPIAQILAPRYRIKCQTITKKSSVQLILAITKLGKKQNVKIYPFAPAKYDGDTSLPPTIFVSRDDSSRVTYERIRPTKIRIQGTYTAASRERSIDETVMIMKD